MNIDVKVLNPLLLTIPGFNNGQSFIVLFNGTKKRFNELCESYMVDETIFRPLKFKLFIESQGHLLYYQGV